MGVQIRRADAVDTAVVALLGRITFGDTFGHLFRAHRFRDNACAGRPARSRECKSLSVKV
jgi:hypothetical protein